VRDEDILWWTLFEEELWEQDLSESEDAEEIEAAIQPAALTTGEGDRIVSELPRASEYRRMLDNVFGTNMFTRVSHLNHLPHLATPRSTTVDPMRCLGQFDRTTQQDYRTEVDFMIGRIERENNSLG